MTFTKIDSGAESTIFKDKTNNIIRKLRQKKEYRHPELDNKLIRQRTKKETKVLKDIEIIGIKAPKLIQSDTKKGIIEMSYVPGKKLRDTLEIQHAKPIAETISKLHNSNLIHGDLTTSNMILNINKNSEEEIFLIDFGLSFTSTRIEDKAVDIHLLKQALFSRHTKLAEEFWQKFLLNYNPNERKIILERFETVELRGRNKA